MTKAFDRRFSPFAVAAALRLLGAALVALAAQELAYGHLDVSRGLLWARRWDALPLLPPVLQGLLWLMQAACGVALLIDLRARTAIRVAAAALALGLTQAYFNQKMLLTLTFLALSLDPPDPRAEGFAETPRPELALAAGQLLLLYLASAAFKLRAGFCAGDSLVSLFSILRDRGLSGLLSAADMVAWLSATPGRAPALSVAVVAAEAALPFLLYFRPLWGLVGAVVLHLSFSLWMPALWPFTLTATALALLFLPETTTRPRFARMRL